MRALLIAALALPVTAWAAGGHHGVDDASIVGNGDCEFESWATRASRRDQLLHAGGQCGIANVEIGIAVEPARQDGARSDTWQAQVKWAGELQPSVLVGFSITPQWDSRARPAFQGTTVSALLTLQPTERWQLHANLGRDFLRDAHQARSGVAADWTSRDGQWMVAAERYVEDRTHFARAGLRWFANERWVFDFSRAKKLHGPRPSTWTFGATREFTKS